MASFCSSLLHFSSVLCCSHFVVPRTSTSRIVLKPRPLVPASPAPSPQRFSLEKGFQFSCFRSSVETNQYPPGTAIFIEGLPVSTSEGRLKKAFSEFGEVERVQLVPFKVRRQRFVSALVWFTNEESAQLAMKEMSGKFFDGRFIVISIAKHSSRKLLPDLRF